MTDILHVDFNIKYLLIIVTIIGEIMLSNAKGYNVLS